MKLLVVVALCAAFGCGCKRTKPDDDKLTPGSNTRSNTGSSTGSNPSTDLDVLDAETKLEKCPFPPPGPGCSYAHCGGNSARINAFPLNGFRTNGDCNDDQIQLVPGSMQGGRCDGMTLDIEGDKLVGRNGTTTCKDEQLEGASFKIRTKDKNARITIVEVTTYVAPNGRVFPAYRMDWKLNNDEHPLCGKEGQKLREKLGVQSMKWHEDISDPQKQLVIAIKSELYDETGTAVEKARAWWKDPATVEWNHLACVDDALAKRTINDQHKPTEPAVNRAALRMWTADYCGGRPFTIRGKFIDWDDPNLPIEAHWNETGAACLTKPRIVVENGKDTVPKKTGKMLDKWCAESGEDCMTVKGWIAAAKQCRKGTRKNNVYDREEDIPDCAGPCAAPKCLLQSSNVK
jgi:hypothetical protein